MTRVQTTEQFKNKLKIINPSIEILGEYVNSKSKILARDKRCNHKWKVIPNSLLNGHGCPNQECIQKRKNQVTSRTTNRLGETNSNTYGLKMTIIEYKTSDNMTIQFENGFITKHRSYRDFKRGYVETPYDKSVYGIGYIGEGEYGTNINNKTNIIYPTWHGMIGRCYNEKIIRKQPTYRDVIVCEEWHNFQVFAKWFDENYYKVDGQTMQVDKDILFKGNKIYSPKTCIFVPQCINVLFVKNDANRGNFPIGVTEKKDKNGYIYRARCNDILLNRCIHLGYYSTPEKAYEQYKYYKEKHIKQVADFYKDQIPIELYNAMYNYIVEITD